MGLNRDNYDMLIIGAGPAGQKAAIQAAKLGKRVAIIDALIDVGGCCVHTGTIPSKSFREAVLYLSGFRQRNVYGHAYRVKSDIQMRDLNYYAQSVRQSEIDMLKIQLQRNKVELIQGCATFEDDETLKVATGGRISYKKGDFYVIATGARPHRPDYINFDGSTIFDSDDFLNLEEIPRSLAIIGGGVIGIEYASMFSALGVHVTVIDGREKLLEFIDREIVDCLIYRLRTLGTSFRLGEFVSSCEKMADGRGLIKLQSGKVIVADRILVCAGRISNTEKLGLEKTSVVTGSRGEIKVDSGFRTGAPHIFAAGDVIGFPALASISAEQGRLASCNAFGVTSNSLQPVLPYGIYSVPELSVVGKNEHELTAEQVPYEVGISRYREITKGHLVGDRDGMLKLIIHRETKKIMGVHIVGEQATELIHTGQSAMMLGAGLDHFLGMVFNYPTLSSCYKVAALDAYNKLSSHPV